MRCHDKLESRRIQAEAVPEATPQFAAVDLDEPDPPAPLPYPFFLKPVAAHLSQLAYRCDGPADFAAALAEARAHDRRGHRVRRALSRGATLQDADRRGAARRRRS